MTNAWKYFLGLLALVTATVWVAFFSYPKANLEVIACDVGQGDAILVQKENIQILVDGGKGGRVLECLSSHMPAWDRKLELVVLSHPQFDHFGGLIEVVRRYEVEAFLTSGLDSPGKEFQVLKKDIEGKGVTILKATENNRLRLGTIYLDILWPTPEFIEDNVLVGSKSSSPNVLGAYTSKKDPNDFSIVVNLRFGEFDALLTGDIGPSVIDDILAKGEIYDVEYLKIPHHGSKNGLTQSLVHASSPEIAVISVGKNPWGHPHGEVLVMLENKDIKILRTDTVGDVIVETDGKSWWIK